MHNKKKVWTLIPLWLLQLWAVIGILVLLFTAYIYLKWPGFSEQGEVNFSAVSWLLYQGYPLYVPLDYYARYSLQHGPNIYIINGFFMKLFGPIYTTAKIAGISALLVSLGLTATWLSKTLKSKWTLILLGIESWLLLHWHYSFASRPDSMMLLCTTAGMYFATSELNKVVKIVGLGIFLGLIANLKIHGIIYFLPILLLAYNRLNKKDFFWLGSIALLLVLLPFTSKQISLTNYAFWIAESLHTETQSIKVTVINFIPKLSLILEFVISICAWAVILRASLKKYYYDNKWFIIYSLFTMFTVSIIGSKPGSGTNHLMPTIPMYVYSLKLLLELSNKNIYLVSNSVKYNKLRAISYSIILVVMLTLTISGINRDKSLMQSMAGGDRTPVFQELTSIVEKYKGKTIEIGYGEDKSYTEYRDYIPFIVFKGNPLLVEVVAMGDMRGVSPSTIKQLENGLIQVWLIPAGNSPFMLNNDHAQTFDTKFREAFIANYELEESRNYFDVWVYKKR